MVTMMELLTRYYETFQEYIDQVHSLLPQNTGEPILFDTDHLVESVVKPAFQAAMALYAIHFGVIVPILDHVWPKKKSDTPEEALSRSRVAFQITNFIGNLVMTVVGFVIEFDARRNMGVNNVQYRIQGFDDFGILPAWQIGVQIWSFPLGLLMVEEDSIMLVHHVALAWTALLPCCFRAGFRWHAPFFFGVFELSSLPLGAMALFKAHPAWMQEYPALYQNTRVVFAIAFLLVRIVWSLPKMLVYLADTGTFIFGLPFGSLTQGYCLVNFLGALILFGMQFYWGSLVVAGLTKFVLSKKGKPEKTVKEA